MALFASMPPELVLMVTALLARPDQAALAAASPFFYRIVNPIIYTDNVKVGNSSCLFWAAERGRIGTLKHALACGADLNVPLLPLSCEKGGADGDRARNVDDGDDDDDGNININNNNNANANANANASAATATAAAASHGDHESETAQRDGRAKFYTILAVAAKYGDRQMAEWLLDNGAYVDAPTFQYCECRLIANSVRPGWRPLHTAICHGRTEVAELLISHGADVHNVSADADCKVPALHYAASKGLVPLVKLLALDINLDINECDHADNTALHYACHLWRPRAKQAASVTYTIEKLLCLGAEIEHQNADGYTPLLYACMRGNFEAAQILLRTGANPEPHASYMPDFADVRPTYYCVQDWHRFFAPQCRVEWERLQLLTLKTLLDRGADIDARFKRTMVTPLILAARHGLVQATTILCRAGALVDAFDDGRYTALRHACDGSDQAASGEGQAAEIVRILLRYGARLDLKDAESRSPLDVAVIRVNSWDPEEKDLLVFRTMVEHATAENVSEACLLDSLVRCARTGNAQGLRGLLGFKKRVFGISEADTRCLLDEIICRTSGSEIFAETFKVLLDFGRRAESNEFLLWKCLQEKNKPLALAILSRGVAVSDSKFWSGQTFLHMACRWGELELVEALLERAADVNAFDRDMQTPLAIAVIENDDEIADALMLEMADPFLMPPPALLEEYCYLDGGPSVAAGGASRTVPFSFAYLTAFDLAIRLGRVVILSSILSRYNLPDIPPGSRNTYVHRACRNLDYDGLLATLTMLLDRGANPNGGDQCPEPPLNSLLRHMRDHPSPPDFAARHLPAAALLISRGANQHLLDVRGETAFGILRSIENCDPEDRDLVAVAALARDVLWTSTRPIMRDGQATGDLAYIATREDL